MALIFWLLIPVGGVVFSCFSGCDVLSGTFDFMKGPAQFSFVNCQLQVQRGGRSSRLRHSTSISRLIMATKPPVGHSQWWLEQKISNVTILYHS